MIFNRKFSMPSSETFSMLPIAELLGRWLDPETMDICDPFARNSKWANLSNDLNPNTECDSHLPMEEFLSELNGTLVDAVLLDPPYSPRQISECYQSIGKVVTAQDTQNARLYKIAKDGLDRILKPDGIAICCGWNSMGFGLKRGYEMLEILMVNHGAAHNDTIVTVERKHAPRS